MFSRRSIQCILPALVLGVLGLAAIARACELFDLPMAFERRQLWCILAAAAVCAAISRMHLRFIAEWSYSAFLLNLLLLAAVFALPTINGVHRWIRVGPIGFQPSELAKLTVLLALARYFQGGESQRHWRGLAIPFAMALVPLLLILREPDLGTALVFLPVLFVMLAATGARLRDLGLAAAIGLLLTPLLWSQMSREQRSRVTALWEQTGPGQRPTPDGYQLHQSKQMLALGGVWGSIVSGELTADRAVYHLPVAHSDFIFAVIGERFGLIGALVVLALFSILVSGMLAIARSTREPFARLLCVGIAALFSVEVLINSGMSVGLAPVTGLSLPLVSYGGSGLVVHAAALGLVLCVARQPGYNVGPAPFIFSRRGRNSNRT